MSVAMVKEGSCQRKKSVTGWLDELGCHKLRLYIWEEDGANRW